jgi:AraC-like DNA-binding protein
MSNLAHLPLATRTSRSPVHDFGAVARNLEFIEVSIPQELSDLGGHARPTQTQNDKPPQGREKLLWQLLVGEDENLRRLYSIVTKAGFKIIFCQNEKNLAPAQDGIPPIPTLAVGGLTPRTLSRVRDYVETHLAEPIGLEALANITGLSRCYFARAFKRSMGMPPHHYLMQRRLECAKRLLAETNMSLAQIALESGFSDQSHFSRRFRDRIGLTPRAYRRLGR